MKSLNKNSKHKNYIKLIVNSFFVLAFAVFIFIGSVSVFYLVNSQESHESYCVVGEEVSCEAVETRSHIDYQIATQTAANNALVSFAVSVFCLGVIALYNK